MSRREIIHRSGSQIQLLSEEHPESTAGQQIPITVVRQELSSVTSIHRTVQWDQNVIDNENLNRKSSKVCCIYHKNGKEKCQSSSDEESEEKQVVVDTIAVDTTTSSSNSYEPVKAHGKAFLERMRNEKQTPK